MTAPEPAAQVALRPWSAGDLDLLKRLLGDPAMMTHLGGPESPQQIEARQRRYLAMPASEGGLYAIVIGPEKRAVGWIGFWKKVWRGHTEWETGWHVLPECQGRGVATGALGLMIEQVRARGPRSLHAFPSVTNEASNALCRRLGFTLVGETDFEYPPGQRMRCNDWRLDP